MLSPLPGGLSVDLTDRVAVVTGATRGLGRQIAEALARCGADVVVSSRKGDACAEVAAHLARLTGRRVLGHACHVGRWDDVEALVAMAYGELGTVDILINNAGMSPLYDDLAGVSEDLFDKTIAVNLKGPFRMGALVGTRMAAGHGGSIINVSSTAAARPTPSALPYAAAKAGLNALTVGMALAFGPSVRVNAIMPGPFRTDVSEAWDMEAVEHRARTFALGRIGEPHEVVGAVLYFASDASSYTTGTVLAINGGEP